jgi:hypothetical protein
MRLRSTLLACAGSLLIAAAVYGQGNTLGTISGKVVDPDGLSIPGVTITVASPALQGMRTTVSSPNGDFILPLLPAGDYTITFELQGFNTVKQTQRVSPGETMSLPAVKLALATVTETVNVVGRIDNFAQTAAVTTSYKADLIQKLPTNRTLADTVLLAPGVNNTGPGGNAITMSGGMSFENLFLVNGVVVNENLRGQANPLFIEDAIQDTAVTTGAISAEYGRFGGGVVNMITKSGSNIFSGSGRINMENDNWRSVTPFGETKTNKTIPTYTYTFGGPIFKDKLWFFHAGRILRQTRTNTLYNSGIPVQARTAENRFEEKVTYQLTPKHNFRGSVLTLSSDQQGYFFTNAMDMNSVYPRKLPQYLVSMNYNTILTSSFFVEAQYSKRHMEWQNDGSRFTDIINGTRIDDRATGGRFWSPVFCGVCTPEDRDNWDVLLKASYFLSTSSTGSHNMVFGFDAFKDFRLSNNHQSGSDYIVSATRAIRVGDTYYPVFTNDRNTFINYRPILVLSQGTDFRTYSGFFNDSWRFSNNLTFNAGVRFDKNHGVDSMGQLVSNDSAWSPRLSATYDPAGTGKTTFNVSYARYVAGLANSIADAGSAGGQPANYQWYYLGPNVNTDPNAALVPSDVALGILFNWFNSVGGTKNPNLVSASIPGVSTRIGGSLKSPYTQEIAFGVYRQIPKGSIRVDAMYRKGGNFYGSFTDMSTGQVKDEFGRSYDMTLVKNTDNVERHYIGVNFNFIYRPTNRVNVGGVWTISKANGSIDGETTGSGPVRTGVDQYPEYKQTAWNNPVGDLGVDQRHRVRAWASYDQPTGPGTLSIAVLEQFNTGVPYGAVGAVDARPYVTNPGYALPQGGNSVTYYYTARDAYRMPNVYRTDLSLTYSYKFGKVETFWQGQVLNAFNGQSLAIYNNINQNVFTKANPGAYGSTLQAFNPFTTQPVQGVNWMTDPGSSSLRPFGQATRYEAYQTPRTFRFNFGVRF